MKQIKISHYFHSVDDIGTPWRRGIGNDSRKVYDKRDRLVCEVHSATDGTLIVQAVNLFVKQQTEDIGE